MTNAEATEELVKVMNTLSGAFNELGWAAGRAALHMQRFNTLPELQHLLKKIKGRECYERRYNTRRRLRMK